MASPDFASNGQYLATLDADGAPPEHRINNAEQAERVYYQMWNGYNYGRGILNARVQGAINGNPPVSQAKLDAEGLGWQSNLNFRLLEGDVNSAQIPLYMLFADVPTYAQITTEVPNVTAEDNLKFGQVISEEHTALNNEWKYFDYNMQLSIANMVKYGSGPLYFPYKGDFRFRAAPQGNVFVPDETTQNLDELSLMFIYYEWELTDLYRCISHKKSSEAGWDVENIKRILTLACNEYQGFTRNRSWEYWEQKIREDDVYWSNVVPRIRTAWGYVREFDGKITRFLITAQQTTGQGKWMYYKDREYDNWSQIIHPMFYEIGNGNWNGVKGIGVKAFNFRDAQNRLKNKVLDAAFLGSQILLQAQDAKTAEDLQLLQLGPMAIVPPGVTFNQMPLLSTIDKPMMVDRGLEVDLQRNIGGTRQNIADTQSNQPISAREAQINATYSSQVTQAQQTIWLRQLDDLYEEQMDRLKTRPRTETKNYPHEGWEKLVAKFHERCKNRGVPMEAFKHIKSVKATRSIGRGSEYFKQQIGMQVYQMMSTNPNVPQGVVTRHFRNMVSNMTGREYLEMIWPEAELSVNPTPDMSKAQDENGIMVNGVPPIWTPEQNNLAHLTTHLQFVAQQIQGVEQGQLDPAAYLKMAQVALPHIQQTIQALRGQEGKTKQFQQFWNMFEQISAKTNQIGQQFQQHQQAMAVEQQKAQAMQQQAQQTGQLLDPESQVKMARVQADAQIKGLATQAEIQRKNAIAQADIVHKNVTVRQQLGMNDLKTAQELRIKKGKSDGTKT